jgi:xyloglucan-specific exo-beta-1,4-glucanase
LRKVRVGVGSSWKMTVSTYAWWLPLLSAVVSCGGSGSSPPAQPSPDGAGNGGTAPVDMPSGGKGNSTGNTPNGEGAPPIVGIAGEAGTGGSAGGPESPAPGPAACDASSANSSGYCFRSAKIGGGGFVSGIVTSKLEQNLIFARTDVGGAYRWNEAGRTWIPLNDWVSEDEVGFLGVESLALDPQEPSRVYMLVGINYFNGGKTAIVSSSDYGQTFAVHEVTAQFKAHGNGLGRQSGERLAVDPALGSVLYVGTRDSGLFKSVDRGETFSRVASLDVTTTPNGNGIAFVVFDPASGVVDGATRTLYAGVSRAGETNLFVSQDAGATWNAVPSQPTNFVPQRAALSGDGALYVTYGNGAGPSPSETDPMDRGEIWKLDTALGAWTEVTPLRGEQNRAFGGISVDSANPARLLATTINTYQQQPWGYGDRIFLSTDAGASWTDLFGAGRVQMDTNGFPWIGLDRNRPL